MKDINFEEINSCSDNEVGQEKMSVAKNKLNEILAKIPSAFEKYRKMHDEKN